MKNAWVESSIVYFMSLKTSHLPCSTPGPASSMILRDESSWIGTAVCGTVAARRLDAVPRPSGLAGFGALTL
jgi:hypothetical protein